MDHNKNTVDTHTPSYFLYYMLDNEGSTYTDDAPMRHFYIFVILAVTHSNLQEQLGLSALLKGTSTFWGGIWTSDLSVSATS